MSFLVLSRDVDEDIIIGTGVGKITIRLMESHRGRARLGIDAPSHIPVHRKEVADRIEKEGRDRRKPVQRRQRSMPGSGGVRFA